MIFRDALEVGDDFPMELSDEIRSFEGWDSLAQLTLIANLDEEFGIQIEQKEFSALVTLGDLKRAIENKLQNGTS